MPTQPPRNPQKELAALDDYRRAKLGTLYGKFWVAPGVRWPSEFNEQGLWDPLPPKKPAESVRFAREEERLKKAVGAELEFRADSNDVTGPSLMAATALASHNSDGENSGKVYPLLLAEDVEKILPRLDIPHHLRRTLPIFWAVCTRPYGREPRLWKGVDDFARAAQICPRTARYHLRHFERMELIEVAVDSTGKKLVANTVNRPTTYRLRNETLVRNRWPECKRCGHKHQSQDECGCQLPNRRGSFYTKEGKRISKIVGRTCRCKPPQHEAPTPIRPKSSYSRHSSPRPSPPVQEAASVATSPLRPADAAPVAGSVTHDVHRTTGRRLRQLTSRDGAKLVAKMIELMRGCEGHKQIDGYWVDYLRDPDNPDPRYRAPMSQEKALISACMTLGIPHEAALEHLKLCQWQFEDAEPSP